MACRRALTAAPTVCGIGNSMLRGCCACGRGQAGVSTHEGGLVGGSEGVLTRWTRRPRTPRPCWAPGGTPRSPRARTPRSARAARPGGCGAAPRPAIRSSARRTAARPASGTALPLCERHMQRGGECLWGWRVLASAPCGEQVRASAALQLPLPALGARLSRIVTIAQPSPHPNLMHRTMPTESSLTTAPEKQLQGQTEYMRPNDRQI